MRNDTNEQIRNLLFKNPDSQEAKDFMAKVEEKIKDSSINQTTAEELFKNLPDNIKNEHKESIEEGLELLEETVQSIMIARGRNNNSSNPAPQPQQTPPQDPIAQIKNDNQLREIQKIEKLITYYNENQLSAEEIEQLKKEEQQKSQQLEKDKKLLNELKEAAAAMHNPINEQDWHPALTEEQKEDLIAEGITPGSPEYDIFLRNHGIDPKSYIGIDKEIENKKKEIEEQELEIEKQIKIINSLENLKKSIDPRRPNAARNITKTEDQIKREKEKLNQLKAKSQRSKVELITLENSKLIYDPRLTKEQKEDLIAEGITPNSPEYNTALMGYGITPIDKMKELESKVQQEEQELNKIQEKLKRTTSLEELKEIKEAYETIKNTVIKDVQKSIDEEEEFKNLSGSQLLEKVEDLINNNIQNHEKVNNLNKWENSDKLMKELKEDIKEGIKLKKQKKPLNEGSNEKLWLKGLAGATGFIAGIGLNMAVGAVPLIGTGLALYSGARLLYNTGKLACSITTKLNNGQEPKWISNIKSKIPEKVKKGAEAIFNKPKNPYAKWFVNGMSLGYTMDRIFNIHEKVGNAFGGNKTTAEVKAPTKTTEAETTHSTEPTAKPTSEQPVTPTQNKTTTAQNPTPNPKSISTAQEPTPIINPEPVIDPTSSFTAGEAMDISGLEYGYVGPGQQAVHLLTDRGAGAVFDKMEVINGQEWVHFKQANGTGYAWFPKEEVEELLASVAKRGGR